MLVKGSRGSAARAPDGGDDDAHRASLSGAAPGRCRPRGTTGADNRGDRLGVTSGQGDVCPLWQCQLRLPQLL